MADRVGIPEARDSKGGRYGRASVDADPRPFDPKDLFCGGCTAPVSAVSGYAFRTPSGGEGWRSPHFRRSHRDGHSSEHDDGCPFDFKKRATEILHESHGTLTQNGDDYELRLPSTSPQEPDAASPPRGTAGSVARLQVTPTDSELAPMLRTAAGIVKLLHRFERSSDATARFRALYQGKRIAWNRFCLEASDTESLLAHLRRPEAQQHPITVHGAVLETAEAHSRGSFLLRDTHSARTLHDGQSREVLVVVRSKNGSVFRGTGPGDQWLAYGNWHLWPQSTGRRLEIQLWIDSPASLTTW